MPILLQCSCQLRSHSSSDASFGAEALFPLTEDFVFMPQCGLKYAFSMLCQGCCSMRAFRNCQQRAGGTVQNPLAMASAQGVQKTMMSARGHHDQISLF